MKRLLIATLAGAVLAGPAAAQVPQPPLPPKVAGAAKATATAEAKAAARSETKVQARADAAPEGLVVIHCLAGQLRVETWDRREVRVEGTLRPANARVRLDRAGDQMTVKVVLPHAVPGAPGPDLVIRVPRASRVEVHTFTGDIETKGLRGASLLKTMSGDIRVADGRSSVSAESVSGDIRILGGRDTVRAQSGSGDVALEQGAAVVELVSITGEVRVVGTDVRGGSIKSVNGRIHFQGDLGDQAHVEFENMNGDTELFFDRDVGASFRVTSFRGGIASDFGGAPVRTSKYTSRQELTFSNGSGTATVLVNVINGDVQLRKRS